MFNFVNVCRISIIIRRDFSGIQLPIWPFGNFVSEQAVKLPTHSQSICDNIGPNKELHEIKALTQLL